MVKNHPSSPRADASASVPGEDVESALRLWRAFAGLVNAKRAVQRAPSEGTILALCAAHTAWAEAQAELYAAVRPARPPA